MVVWNGWWVQLRFSNLQEESRARPPLRKLSEESWLKKWLVLDLGLQVPKVGKTQKALMLKTCQNTQIKELFITIPEFLLPKRADSHFTQNLWKVYFSAWGRSYLLPDVPSSQNECAFPHSTFSKIHCSHPSPFPSGLGRSIFFFACLAMWPCSCSGNKIFHWNGLILNSLNVTQTGMPVVRKFQIISISTESMWQSV